MIVACHLEYMRGQQLDEMKGAVKSMIGVDT
jgi:hypothetical protein